jgi:leucyl-tRNA synthetase
MFVLSDSPAEKDLEWSSSGLDGCKKFISRLENFIGKVIDLPSTQHSNKKLQSQIHATIKNVTDDIIHYRLNKAIARIRELFNAANEELSGTDCDSASVLEAAKNIVRLLNPFIPHITEELWQKLGNNVPLFQSQWPEYDKSRLKSDSYMMAIQINGKLRATHEFAVDDSEDKMKEVATRIPVIAKHIEGAKIKKIIVVPKKIINIVK